MEVVSERREFEASFIVKLSPEEQFSFLDGNRRVWVKQLQIQFRGQTAEEARDDIRPRVQPAEAYQIRANQSLGRKVPSYLFVPRNAVVERILTELRLKVMAGMLHEVLVDTATYDETMSSRIVTINGLSPEEF